MEIVITSLVIFILIFIIISKYNRRRYIVTSRQEPVAIPKRFWCDRFSFSWNSVNDKENEIEFIFEIYIKSPYDFKITDYTLICSVSMNKIYNFYNNEPRWGFGTTYGDWYPHETKQIKGSVSIPKQDFHNSPKELFFHVSFKGRGKLPVENIGSFKIPVTKWYDIQKELIVKS